MNDDKYDFSEDEPFSLGAGGASRIVWAVAAILLVAVGAWWWSAYSSTDSDQSFGSHIVVVVLFGFPSWTILFGAFLGLRKLVAMARRRL